MTRAEAIDRAAEWAACPASQWRDKRPKPLSAEAALCLHRVADRYGHPVAVALRHVERAEDWLTLRSFARYLAWGLNDQWWYAVANVAAMNAPIIVPEIV